MARTYFFWDPLSDNILQERDETGAVTAEYTAEPGLYGNIISQNRGGVESQFHYDAQGSTLAVTDDDQNVTDTFAYTAFGEITERTGTTEVPFQYIGQKGYYTDSVTGQIMARRRPFAPNTVRWLSPDPRRPEQNAQRYNYVGNRPTRAADPAGLEAVIEYMPPVDNHPWNDERIGLGWLSATRFDWIIHCNCYIAAEFRCLANNRCIAKVNCSVTLRTRISLDLQAIRADPGYGTSVTVQGSYGHEQQHAECFYNLATKEIAKQLSGARFIYSTKGKCKEPPACVSQAQSIEQSLDTALQALRSAEMAHGNPCSPIPGSDVPPTGTMPPDPT